MSIMKGGNMRKYMIVIAAAAIMLGFAVKAGAAESSKDKDPGKTGIVTAVDSFKGTITIKRDGDNKPFTFECESEVIDGIMTGDHVSVWYDRKGDKRVATKVERSEKKKEEKKEEQKKEEKKSEEHRK